MTTSHSIETLLEHYQVDRAHGRHVADLALALFDSSAPLHGLTANARELLETGALLHNIGLHIDERKHHSVGRDILLNTTIENLNDDERAVIACLVAFHRKKVRPETEAAFLRLGKKKQYATLYLAAILRVADGLDYAQSQTTTIEKSARTGDELHVTLAGPHAAADAARATEKANLWEKVFGAPIVLNVATDEAAPTDNSSLVENDRAAEILADTTLVLNADESTSPDAQPTPESVLVATDGSPLATTIAPASDDVLVRPDGAPLATTTVQFEQAPWKLQPTDTLSEAARKVLRRYFHKLLAQEADLHDSDDPEDIHQMRVATRRLRATLQALGAAIDGQQSQRFRRQIRAIAGDLGTVRDHDVFLEHIAHYNKEHASDEPSDLAPLVESLTKEQHAAKKRLLRKLKKRNYTRFKRAFARFVTASDRPTDTAGDGPVPLVRYAAGSAIWRAYEQLRAHETVVPIQQQFDADQDMTKLHELRIAGKHFRYTLELFSDALGPRVDEVLAPLVDLQEHLGALQDIEVASGYIAALPAADDHSDDSDHSDALTQYVAARHDDRAKLLEELPARWAKVASATYRRRLMEVILKL